MPSFRAVLHVRVRATRTDWLRLHRARLAEGRANRLHDQLDEHKQHNRHRDLLIFTDKSPHNRADLQ
jgi:hypothetical protein